MKFKHIQNLKITDIDINLSETVVQVKQKLSVIVGWPTRGIKLIYQDMPLDDNSCISESVSNPDATVLFCCIPKHEMNDIVLQLKINGNVELYQMKIDQAIGDIKIFLGHRFDCSYGSSVLTTSHGQPLWDESTASDSRLNDDDIITVSLEPTKGTVSVTNVVGSTETFTVPFVSTDSVFILKEKIANKIEVPIGEIALFLRNKCLDEQKQLAEYQVTDGALMRYLMLFGISDVTDHIKIHQGAICKIFRCTEVSTKKQIILKRYKLLYKDKFEKYRGLLNEVMTFMKLGKHHRIVDLLGLYKDNKLHFYVAQEYMTGGSLRDFLKQAGPLEEDKIFYYAKQILEGLTFIHENEIIHRDIRGSNILFDQDRNNLKLSNFGLSKYMMGCNTAELLSGIDRSGQVVCNWMAPEVIRNEAFVISSDIWSFGATLIEMVTGLPPYYPMENLTVVLILGRKQTIEFKPPSPISWKLNALIESCIKSDPASRPKAADLIGSI